MGYRNDHEAAMRRAEALEQELVDLRKEKADDEDKITSLKDQIRRERIAAAMGDRPQLPSKADLALGLALAAIVLFPILAPVAWYLAQRELNAINAGEADPTKRGTANVARLIGIVWTAFMGLGFLYMLFGLRHVHF